MALIILFGGIVGTAAAHSDSITFMVYPDGIDALDAISNGTLDMHTEPILPELVEQALEDPNLQIYNTAGAFLYTLYLNPAMGESFNPFSIREVRYAMNHLLDRDRVVRDVLYGQGTAISSVMYPLHPDYPLAYRYTDTLDLSYDPVLADRMITEALITHGAYKVDGVWHHDGGPVYVTMFVRDDYVIDAVSKMLTVELERVGFMVEHEFGGLDEFLDTVRSTDPMNLEWHLTVEAWGGFSVQKTSNSLGWWYSPAFGNMPGRTNPDFWNYENRLIDDFALAIYYEDYESTEERTRLIRGVLTEGINDAVRLPVVVEDSNYLVNRGIKYVVNAPGIGPISRYNTLNIQAPDGDITVGIKYITQRAWNPVGGFVDTGTNTIWHAIRDPDYTYNPFTGDLMPERAQWLVHTAEQYGSLAVPEDAIIWNPFTHVWETVQPGSTAASKITLNFTLGNWHNGVPMDINDIFYALYFAIEHSAYHDGHDHKTAVKPRSDFFVDNLQGVRVVDDHAIEVYTNRWDSDSDRIVRDTFVWAHIPWDLLMAMEFAALDKKTAFMADDAKNLGVSWLSMLDPDDTALLREYLEDFVREGHVPTQVLYPGNSTEYVLDRYNHTISWIDAHNHSVIGNGPYQLEAYWPKNETLRVVPFDEHPFEPHHWRWLADLGDFDGTVLVGSVAPLSGGASRYGADISQASTLAVADFNRYLEMRGEPWRMDMVRFDSMTDPEVLLSRLHTLESMGIGIVDGPAIDIITDDVLQFANTHNMLLMSCCSSTLNFAVDGDSLFRLLPDQRMHGEVLANLMFDEGIRAIAPVAIDGSWSKGLLHATKTAFIDMGGSVADTILHGSDTEFEISADMLAANIIELDFYHRLDKMAVLYVGHGEAPEFMSMAAKHKILGDIRWFGADQNTAWPNVLDSPLATTFAEDTEFTVVQPSVPDDVLHGKTHSVIGGYLGMGPSPYAIYEYDSVWLLGLSIMYARSADPMVVSDMLPDIASKYAGLIGSTTLNSTGDLLNTNYAVWVVRDGVWHMISNDY